MGNLASIELMDLVTKPQLKQALKDRGLQNPLITDKVIIKSLIFISGYIRCLQYRGVQPINTQEMIGLLTQECIDWMVEYVEKGGK